MTSGGKRKPAKAERAVGAGRGRHVLIPAVWRLEGDHRERNSARHPAERPARGGPPAASELPAQLQAPPYLTAPHRQARGAPWTTIRHSRARSTSTSPRPAPTTSGGIWRSATSCAPTPTRPAATSGSSAPPRPATPVTGQATGRQAGVRGRPRAPRPGRSRCWPLIVRTIRRDPSGSVWIDGPSNVSRPDRSEPTRSAQSTSLRTWWPLPRLEWASCGDYPTRCRISQGWCRGSSPPAPPEPNLRAGSPWPAFILWSQGTAPGRWRFRGRGQVFRGRGRTG